jgi:hypothetical protein
MDLLLGAGGGFLVAVLWMDLMFDVLALGPRSGAELPEATLEQVTTYYRRVTTTAWPMNLLVSAVMAGMVGMLAFRLATSSRDRGATTLSLLLCGVPIVLALTRIFPNAVRLGARKDTPAEGSRLARTIAIDHLACLAAMVSFLVVRFLA